MSLIAPNEDTALAPIPSALPVEALIAKAIEHGLSVEGLERLLAMRERLKAEAAREAFYAALSAFQSECPVVAKRKTARVESKSGASYSYRYAPLDDIVEAVSGLLAKHGLSHTEQARFEEAPQPAQVVTCTVHHVAGHSESSEFRAPIDLAARMNVIQQNGAALTYAKRYAFCNALGILTGDEDDDGTGAGNGGHGGGTRESRSDHRAAGAVRAAPSSGPSGDEEAEVAALNARLPDGKRLSAPLLKGRLTRPDGLAKTRAELEALLNG